MRRSHLFAKFLIVTADSSFGWTSPRVEGVEEMAMADKWRDRRERVRAAKVLPDTIEDAFASPEEIAETKQKLAEAGVKYVLSCWIDLLGQPKTKPVPLGELDALCNGKGPQFAVHSVSMVPELGPADPDQIPVADLNSLVICPWDKTIAWVFADLFFQGKPYNVCPRLALKRQVQLALDQGLRPMAGIEPEFIVMRFDANGR